MLSKKQLAVLRADSQSPRRNRVGSAISLAGVTQAAVARAAGLPQPYVSDVARGRYQTITLRNARKFAEYFGCAIEDLFPTELPLD